MSGGFDIMQKLFKKQHKKQKIRKKSNDTDKWIVKIPFEGTAYIPIQKSEKPKMFDPEVSNKLHTGFFDTLGVQYYRNKGTVEESDDKEFESVKKRAEKHLK